MLDSGRLTVLRGPLERCLCQVMVRDLEYELVRATRMFNPPDLSAPPACSSSSRATTPATGWELSRLRTVGARRFLAGA